jgi:hypothetical protein
MTTDEQLKIAERLASALEGLRDDVREIRRVVQSLEERAKLDQAKPGGKSR